MKTLLNVKIQQLNVRNANGRTYPQPEMERILPDIQKRASNGYLLGCINYPAFCESIPLELVSHSVRNVRIEDGYLVGDVKILDTPTGARLEELSDEMVFRPMSVAKVDEYGVVSDLTLIAVVAIRAEDAA